MADITVLIPTYNRAEILRKTLLALAAVDRDGLDVVFVVIDNNSSDHTRSAIFSMKDAMPLRYLFAPRQGKSSALNLALDTLPLGKIIVGADDDIVPRSNWLAAISSACDRWPAASVFGGRVEPIWPNGNPPLGLRRPGARTYALGTHGICAHDCAYAGKEVPVGANWWARAELFDRYRFSESIGPKGMSVIMGEDTEFFRRLKKDGFEIIHIPEAAVGHRIQSSLVTPFGLMKRAYNLGRGGAHLHGFSRHNFKERNALFHKLKPMLICGVCCARFSVGLFHPEREDAAAIRLAAVGDLGYQVETLRMRKILYVN